MNKFDETVYRIDFSGNEEEMTYGELVTEFADMTTSPIGVQSRYHLRENDDNEEVELWSWGILGQNLFHVKTFDTEEEADYALLETFEEDMENDCSPSPYEYSRKELKERAKESEIEYTTLEEQEKERVERDIISTERDIKKAKSTKEWKEKYGIAKNGSDFDNAQKWFDTNKSDVTAFILKGNNKIGTMSCKLSKRVAWAICQDIRFDTRGINTNSLSHVIR